MSEWISVKHSLPPDGDDVIVWSQFGQEAAVMTINNSHKSAYLSTMAGNDCWSSIRYKDITHWMPLVPPQP